MSTVIENAYLVENLKAKFDGNKSFEDVARSVYDDLKEYLDSNMRAKYDYAFDNKKTQSKRKMLNVPDE